MVGGREIIDALVHPDHRGPSPDLKRALEQWPGPHYWSPGDGPGRLVLIRALAPPTRERWWLHLTLFAVTFVTVAIGGALIAGAEPRWSVPAAGGFAHWSAAVLDWGLSLGPGLEFAMALLGILLAHECGHYFLAKRYAINVSPPYFLPAPPPWIFLGTLGAFIRLRSPVVDRRQLMDVGAAGPWVGFIAALLVLGYGLSISEPVAAGGRGGVMVMPEAPLYPTLFLGDSLVVAGLRLLIVGDGAVRLHPLALAGWLGVFVTMLNLLPFGQLDGGHVLYALLGRRQRLVGTLTWLALVVMGYWFWGWWIWAVLTLLLGRGRLAHPSVLDRVRPVPSSRRWLGWATVALFVLTFTPVPFHP